MGRAFFVDTAGTPTYGGSALVAAGNLFRIN